jgi:hypothetical protein
VDGRTRFCALTSYIQTGIVDGGFRGELLTKILRLMVVKESMEDVVLPSSSNWQYVPVKVSAFLDNLIAAPPNFDLFSDAIRATSINDERLNRLLDGHVFFNHFLRMEEKLIISLLVQGLNRGAAFMCKTDTSLIDHVIPVILANTRASPPRFGLLYDKWDATQIEEAQQNIACIVFNSNSWMDPKSSITTYITANNSNIENWESAPRTSNNKLCMTIMQEFGSRQNQEEHITIFPSHGEKKSLEDTTQVYVILKDMGDQIYTGFQKNYIHPLAQKYLEVLRLSSREYHDYTENKLNSILRDNIPLCLLLGRDFAVLLFSGYKPIDI